MVSFNLNGQDVSVDVPADTTLLSVLTDHLHLAGAKYGCGKSQCGACMVLVDGNTVFSCQTLATAAAGRSVTTVEGLLENGQANALQRAMIEEQAAQCGYCSAGIIVAAQALLDTNPQPTEAEIRTALNGNLCRCGTQNRVVRAVLRAAEEGA